MLRILYFFSFFGIFCQSAPGQEDMADLPQAPIQQQIPGNFVCLKLNEKDSFTRDKLIKTLGDFLETNLKKVFMEKMKQTPGVTQEQTETVVKRTIEGMNLQFFPAANSKQLAIMYIFILVSKMAKQNKVLSGKFEKLIKAMQEWMNKGIANRENGNDNIDEKMMEEPIKIITDFWNSIKGDFSKIKTEVNGNFVSVSSLSLDNSDLQFILTFAVMFVFACSDI